MVEQPERRLKANKVLAGQECGWCREALALGEDAAVCGECNQLHHASCWDVSAGCAGPGCVNAPLTQVPTAAGAEPPPLDKVYCASCQRLVSKSMRSCPFCYEPMKRTPRRRPHRYRDRVPKSEKMPAAGDWVLCILCPGIGCIVGIIALAQGETKRGGIMIAVGLGVSLVFGLLRAAMEGAYR